MLPCMQYVAIGKWSTYLIQGSYNKVPLTRWLINNLFLIVPKVKSKIKATADSLVKTLFWVLDFCLFIVSSHGHRVGESFLGSLYEDANDLHEDSLCDMITSQRLHLLMLSHLGVKVSKYEFWKDTHLRSNAVIAF